MATTAMATTSEDSVSFGRIRDTGHLGAYGFVEVSYEDAKDVMLSGTRVRRAGGLYVEDDDTIGAIRAIVGPSTGTFEHVFDQRIGTSTILYNLPTWKNNDPATRNPNVNVGDVLDFFTVFIPHKEADRNQWQTMTCGKVVVDEVRTLSNRDRPLTKLLLKRTDL